MKSTIVFIGLVLSLSSLAEVLGNYTGELLVTDSSGETTLTLSTTVSDSGITSKIGDTSYTLEFGQAEHGRYDVVQEGAVIGRGYCIKTVCHYDANDGEYVISETIVRLEDGNMVRSGSRTEIASGAESLFHSLQVKQ